MRNGWIKLHRQLLDSRVFANEHLLRLWVWILMRANHTTSWVNEHTQVGPGQMLIGRQFLADSLQWKPSTAWERLLKLQEWGMVTLKSDSHGTLLTVCHWQTYQDAESEIQQQSDSEATTARQPTDSGPTHIKNEKNSKNQKKKQEKADCFFDELEFPRGLDTPEVRDSLREFVAYRQEIKKPATLKAMELILAKFEKLGPGCLREAVEESIMNRWTGIFPPKSRGNRNGATHGSTTTKTDPAGTVGQLQRLRSNAKRIPAGD
ncbi:hypothetical protein GYB59_06280 [bacterium]|nr:hypothetical protein [bacterium]